MTQIDLWQKNKDLVHMGRNLFAVPPKFGIFSLLENTPSSAPDNAGNADCPHIEK